jgi:predicted ATP-grasp superfamily ATP-dependent carboligase
LGALAERVLITSAQERSALAACRSLARAGFHVGAIAHETPAAAHWSRSCGERHVLVDAKEDPDAFVDGLAAIAGQGDGTVLLPATDAAMLAVSPRRERLEPAIRVGLPPHAAVEAATDKIALHEAAERAGLSAPQTVVCNDHADGLRAAAELGVPVVIKPRRSVFEDRGVLRQRGSRFVGTSAELEQAVEEFGTPYLLQRLQQGGVWSAAGVLTPEGDVLSFSVSRYVRTWPAEAGNVAFAVTVEPPDGLRERVRDLLTLLGWSGLFELELIRSDAGSFHAIDLNPRLYGSLAHATRAGAPHAVVFVEWLLGRTRAPVTARAGVRYRWEDADARHALWDARGGRWGEAVRTLTPRRDVAHAHFRLNDPGPLMARTIVLARTRLRRGRSG